MCVALPDEAARRQAGALLVRRRHREHSVGPHGVQAKVQVQRRAESLREGHGPAARGVEAVGPGATTMEALERAQPHADDLRGQRGLAREGKAKPARKREHPLPHRHVRERPRDAGDGGPRIQPFDGPTTEGLSFFLNTPTEPPLDDDDG